MIFYVVKTPFFLVLTYFFSGLSLRLKHNFHESKIKEIIDEDAIYIVAHFIFSIIPTLIFRLYNTFFIKRINSQ